MPTTQRGRPRQVHIDVAALEATRTLLVEVGYSGTTVQGIAERAGVSLTAIYRRWPSKLELVNDAIFPALNDLNFQPTGNLPRDLVRFLRAYKAAYATPAARAAIPGLIADLQSPVHTMLIENLRANIRPQFRALLAAAPPSKVDPAVDPDDVFDLLLGSVLLRSFVLPATSRGRTPDRTVDLLCRAVAPATMSKQA